MPSNYIDLFSAFTTWWHNIYKDPAPNNNKRRMETLIGFSEIFLDSLYNADLNNDNNFFLRNQEIIKEFYLEISKPTFTTDSTLQDKIKSMEGIINKRLTPVPKEPVNKSFPKFGAAIVLTTWAIIATISIAAIVAGVFMPPTLLPTLLIFAGAVTLTVSCGMTFSKIGFDIADALDRWKTKKDKTKQKQNEPIKQSPSPPTTPKIEDKPSPCTLSSRIATLFSSRNKQNTTQQNNESTSQKSGDKYNLTKKK